MNAQKIGVGIIGAGGWAQYGHIPALKTLPHFDIVAICTRRKEAAEECAKRFDIPNAFDNEQELIQHPDVNLVVILAPAPEHARLVKVVIAAGKDVYSEWPLTTNTADSEELLALAELKDIKHIVGLQRRFSPSARYTRDLIKQGYIGKIRGVHMTVSSDAFPEIMSQKHAWAFPAENFTNVFSVYTAHFGDMLFQSVGFPKKVSAIVETQFPSFTVEETGEKLPNANPNEVMIIGTLENGGLLSIQVEGGQQHHTGLYMEISGTHGILRITNAKAFGNEKDNLVEGVNTSGGTLSELKIPAEYYLWPDCELDVSAQDVAYLYDTYARDKRNGTSDATNFKDAVRMHKFLDQVTQATEEFIN